MHKSRVAEGVTRPTRVAGASLNAPLLLAYRDLSPSASSLPYPVVSQINKMAPPQLVQLYKEVQQTFMSGNLQQTGVLLARLKVRPRSDHILLLTLLILNA